MVKKYGIKRMRYVPNRSSPLVLVHWPNMRWTVSKGAANQSAFKVQNRQHEEKGKRKKKKKSPFHGSAPSARVMSMNAVYLNSIAVSTFRSEIVTVPFRFWLLYLLFSRRKWTMSRQDSTTTFLNETASELTLANFLSELTCTYA